MQPSTALIANPEAFHELTTTQVFGKPVLSTAPSVQRTMKVAAAMIARIKNASDERQMEMGLDFACDFAGHPMKTDPFFIPLYVEKEKVSHTGVILADGAGLPNGMEDIPIHEFKGMRIVLMKDIDPAEAGYATHREFTSKRLFGRGAETIHQREIKCVPMRKWYFSDTMILVKTHLTQPQLPGKPDLNALFEPGKFIWTVSIAKDINTEVFKVVVSGDNDPVLIKPFPPRGVTLQATDPDAIMLKKSHYYLGSDVHKCPSSDANTGLLSRLALWCSHRAVMLLATVVVIPAILARAYARPP